MSTQAISLLRGWVLRQAGDHEGWLKARLGNLSRGAPERELHITMGLAPRLLGKSSLALTLDERHQADQALPGWQPGRWSLESAARVLALVLYHGPRSFAETFKDLRRIADAGELLALYRGLPIYPEPVGLVFEVGEGLRSNVRAVFEAIAHHNPYPYTHFDQHRWNHMVLKALFIGSRLAPIMGLEARANPELARILVDYAHERRAAGRPVSPELWRCVGPFASEVGAFEDLEYALAGSVEERTAVALALAGNPSPQARSLLNTVPDVTRQVAEGRLSWDNLLQRRP